jgi:hypothetical protein
LKEKLRIFKDADAEIRPDLELSDSPNGFIKIKFLKFRSKFLENFTERFENQGLLYTRQVTSNGKRPASIRKEQGQNVVGALATFTVGFHGFPL